MYVTIKNSLTNVAPSSSPVQIQFNTVTSKSFSLLWDPPSFDDQNGIIKYYVIQLIEFETNITSVFTANATFFSLSSLHPAYTYFCKIAAYTVSLGPFSTQINVTTKEDGRSNN